MLGGEAPLQRTGWGTQWVLHILGHRQLLGSLGEGQWRCSSLVPSKVPCPAGQPQHQDKG